MYIALIHHHHSRRPRSRRSRPSGRGPLITDPRRPRDVVAITCTPFAPCRPRPRLPDRAV